MTNSVVLVSIVILDNNRQRVKDDLIPLVMCQKSTLQQALQRVQSRKLPPTIDQHLAAAVDGDFESRAILAAIFVQCSGVARPARGLLDRVQDVLESSVD